MSSNNAKVLEFPQEAESSDSLLKAITNSYAYIEFSRDGKIVFANENFTNALGYDLDEIVGKHHKTFVDPKEASSPEYKAFWEDLRNGEPQTREFRRVTKSGEALWIFASYIPVKDSKGDVVKVVKLAQNINKQKLQNADYEGKVSAILKTQAVIEFKLDGTVTDANENFCATLGYTLQEIKGKHHSMFCDPTYTSTPQYKAFWEKLNRGEYDTGEYKRLGKGGKEIWIQASYNPIFDLEGKPCKVVKYASDITLVKQLANFKSMVDLSPINTLVATPAGKFTYMNDNSAKTLRTLEAFLPDKVDRLVGQSIDIFHKRPEHQKNIISNVKNLPFKSKIKVGPETLDLLVSPVTSSTGEYVGPMVTWEIITKKLNLVNSLEETSNSLASAANELTATATQMSGNAAKTSSESNNAASAAEEVATGVQTVATNTEEMAASIKEIARSANESAEMSRDTLSKAQNTNKTITQLGASSQEIGNVVKVISSIAQQTNLLALNATIEAARAGDAGKGFAVVANEVKELAKQTAKATEEITNKIGAIQKDSTNAVDAIGGIASAVEKLNGIAGAIAASVEEQNATTNEVSRVVQESSKGVEGIAQTIKVVSAAANENTQAAGQTLDAAKGLSTLAEKLKVLVKSIEV